MKTACYDTVKERKSSTTSVTIPTNSKPAAATTSMSSPVPTQASSTLPASTQPTSKITSIRMPAETQTPVTPAHAFPAVTTQRMTTLFTGFQRYRSVEQKLINSTNPATKFSCFKFCTVSERQLSHTHRHCQCLHREFLRVVAHNTTKWLSS